MIKKLIASFFITSFVTNTAYAKKFCPLIFDNDKPQKIHIIGIPGKKENQTQESKKIYRIGSDDVYYQTFHSDKIERIGNKRVEYRMLNNQILKIGNEFVTYSMGGKMLKVGEKEVIYNGNRIYKIGNDEVFYK